MARAKMEENIDLARSEKKDAPLGIMPSGVCQDCHHMAGDHNDIYTGCTKCKCPYFAISKPKELTALSVSDIDDDDSTVFRYLDDDGKTVGVRYKNATYTKEDWEYLYVDHKISERVWRIGLNYPVWSTTFTGEDGEKTLNKRAEILQTAESLINGDRAQSYGDPDVGYSRVADLWTAMGFMMLVLDKDGNAGHYRKLKSVDVLLAMQQLKISRSIGDPSGEDNWVDNAGYAGLAAEVALRNKDGK
jgi:Domain of unknown function (DUF6378)